MWPDLDIVCTELARWGCTVQFEGHVEALCRTSSERQKKNLKQEKGPTRRRRKGCLCILLYKGYYILREGARSKIHESTVGIVNNIQKPKQGLSPYLAHISTLT